MWTQLLQALGHGTFCINPNYWLGYIRMGPGHFCHRFYFHSFVSGLHTQSSSSQHKVSKHFWSDLQNYVNDSPKVRVTNDSATTSQGLGNCGNLWDYGRMLLMWTKPLGLRHFFETFQKCTIHNSGWTSLFFGPSHFWNFWKKNFGQFWILNHT